MKELLSIVSLLLSGALSEAPAPYPPSGWRPSGPAFELPTNAQLPQSQQYLPPVDPRNPSRPTEFDSGDDVSVQGLPTQEQLPIFQVSPVNGQQYVGPNFNSDIKGLEQNFQQPQFQLQQEKARQFSRQQQFPANPNAASGLPKPQSPRQFVPQPSPAPTTTPANPKEAEPTTESSLNQSEQLDEKDSPPKKGKTSIEVSKQNLQEYPAELFLSSLGQLQLQPQFVPLQQFGQLRESVFYPSVEQSAPGKQVTTGFDGPAHFAALSSVLAQNKLARQQQTLIPVQQAFAQNPAILVTRGQEQPASPIIVPTSNQETLPQYQSVVNQYQPIAQLQEPLPQYQPVINQYQPVVQTQVEQESLPQYQPAFNQYQPIAQPRGNQEALSQYQPDLNQYQPPAQTQVGQEPLPQYQPAFNQYQPIAQPQGNQEALSQYQPVLNPYQPAVQTQVGQEPQYQPVINQYQPITQPQVQSYPQYQAQQIIYQPQPVSQPQSNQNAQPNQQERDVEKNEQEQPQYVYQQSYQPQEVYLAQDNQPQIPANQFIAQPQQNVLVPQSRPINYPNQDLNQYYQNQFTQQQFVAPNQYEAQPIVQGQDGFLQSGLDINQEGNGIDQTEEDDENSDDDAEKDDGAEATAVATAFGTRTQPRVFSQYGAPAPRQRDQANRGYQTTTEANAEETTEDGPAIAQATAVAAPSRNRNAKLRSRRPRPLFTVDRSGHLVLAREQ